MPFQTGRAFWLRTLVAFLCAELVVALFVANRQAEIYALPNPADRTQRIGALPSEKRLQTWEAVFALHYGNTPLWALAWPWRKLDIYRWPQSEGG